MDFSNIQSMQGMRGLIELENQGSATTSKVGNEEFGKTLQKAMENKDDKELKEGCEAIESYMLSYMFKQMKSCMLSGDGLLDQGDYQEMFGDYMIESMCDNMVKAGGVGLADSMYKQMISTYNAQTNLDNSSQIDENL